jgi:hypothetical protein
MKWVEAQEKDSYGAIRRERFPHFSRFMFQYAGKEALITNVDSHGRYSLNIDNGRWRWAKFMFDPSFAPTLRPEDAILAMVEGGETLRDEDGWLVSWDKTNARFLLCEGHRRTQGVVSQFNNLRRLPIKRERKMTRAEAKAWAVSSESLGWMIRFDEDYWGFPDRYGFEYDISRYRRAKLRPDLSGIDESTICGFEVEEVE